MNSLLSEPNDLCDCRYGYDGFIKDAVCNKSKITIIFYACVISVSLIGSIIGIFSIILFSKKPNTLGVGYTIFLLSLFQFTLWSNALFCADIVFEYGRFWYFLFYFMTQMFYFSALGYLYSW